MTKAPETAGNGVSDAWTRGGAAGEAAGAVAVGGAVEAPGVGTAAVGAQPTTNRTTSAADRMVVTL